MTTDDGARMAATVELERCAVDFISALRLAEGFDEVLLIALKESIVEAGRRWMDEESLPKSLVNTLVGLYSWINSSSYLYEDEEARQIQKAAREVESLVFEHVVPSRPVVVMIDRVAQALAVDSPEALSRFLIELAEGARADGSSVENDSSADMVEAAGHWTEGMEAFLRARGVELSQLSVWSGTALIFAAGLVYE